MLLRLFSHHQLNAGGYGLGCGAYLRPFMTGGGNFCPGLISLGWEVTVNACGVAALIFSFRVSQSCDLRRPVADSVVDGTLAAWRTVFIGLDRYLIGSGIAGRPVRRRAGGGGGRSRRRVAGCGRERR